MLGEGQVEALEPDGGPKQGLQPVRLMPVSLPFSRQLGALLEDRPEDGVDRGWQVVTTAGVDHGAVEKGRLGAAFPPAQVPPQRRHLRAAGAAEAWLEQHLR